MKITGNTKLIGILGNPVSRTRFSAYANAAFGPWVSKFVLLRSK